MVQGCSLANLVANRFSDCGDWRGLHCAHKKDRVGVGWQKIQGDARLTGGQIATLKITLAGNLAILTAVGLLERDAPKRTKTAEPRGSAVRSAGFNLRPASSR